MLRALIIATMALFLVSCSGTQMFMLEVVHEEGLRLQKKDQMNGAYVSANRYGVIKKVKDKNFVFAKTLGDSDRYIHVSEDRNSYGGDIEIGGGLTKDGNPIYVPVAHYYNSMVKGQSNEWWYTRFVYCGRGEVAPGVFDDVVVIVWWDEPIKPNHALVATRKHGWVAIAWKKKEK